MEKVAGLCGQFAESLLSSRILRPLDGVRPCKEIAQDCNLPGWNEKSEAIKSPQGLNGVSLSYNL